MKNLINAFLCIAISFLFAQNLLNAQPINLEVQGQVFVDLFPADLQITDTTQGAEPGMLLCSHNYLHLSAKDNFSPFQVDFWMDPTGIPHQRFLEFSKNINTPGSARLMLEDTTLGSFDGTRMILGPRATIEGDADSAIAGSGRLSLNPDPAAGDPLIIGRTSPSFPDGARMYIDRPMTEIVAMDLKSIPGDIKPNLELTLGVSSWLYQHDAGASLYTSALTIPGSNGFICSYDYFNEKFIVEGPPKHEVLFDSIRVQQVFDDVLREFCLDVDDLLNPGVPKFGLKWILNGGGGGIPKLEASGCVTVKGQLNACQNLEVVGYVKASNQVSIIPLWQAGSNYTMNNTSGQDLTHCESGMDPIVYDTNGDVEVKLIIRITSTSAGTNNFQLRAHDGTTETFPIVNTDTWNFASTQTGIVASSEWKDFAAGVNLHELHLYGWVDAGSTDFNSAYLMVRPNP